MLQFERLSWRTGKYDKKNQVNKKKSTFSASDDDCFSMNKTLKNAIFFFLSYVT